MFKEIKDCYEKSASNFVRVVVDEETNVMYLTTRTTMIPMIAPNGEPSLYDGKVKIINYTDIIPKLTKYVGWQNVFVNEADGTMFVGGADILCQLVDASGKPKIFNK